MLLAIAPLALAEETATILFPQIDAAGKIAVEDLAAFEVAVEGAEAQEVQLYLDGVLAGTSGAPFIFNLSCEALGTYNVIAAARLADGSYTEAEKDMTVTQRQEDSSLIVNFDQHTVGNAITNFQMLNHNGDATLEREGNGNCLAWLVNTEDDTQRKPAFRASLGGTTSGRKIVYYSEDFYFQKGVTTIWYVNNGDIQFGNWQSGLVTIDPAGSKYKFDCAPDMWHNVKVAINCYDGRISFWLDGVELLSDAEFTKALSTEPKLSNIYGVQQNLYVNADIVAMIDNVSIQTYLETPFMASINGGSEVVDYSSESAELVLTRALEKDELDPRLLTVTNEVSSVILDSSATDEKTGVLTLTPKGGFEPSNTYMVTIAKGARLADGSALGAPIKLRFKTSAKDIDVVSGGITAYGGNAVFKAKVVNSTGEEENFTAYLAVYENGVFKKLISASCALSSGEAELKTEPYAISSGESFKAFVVNSSVRPISNKIYTYEANIIN